MNRYVWQLDGVEDKSLPVSPTAKVSKVRTGVETHSGTTRTDVCMKPMLLLLVHPPPYVAWKQSRPMTPHRSEHGLSPYIHMDAMAFGMGCCCLQVRAHICCFHCWI